MLNSQTSILESENRKLMYDNLHTFQKPDGNFSMTQKVLFYEDQAIVFQAENSNRSQAQGQQLGIIKIL